MNIFWFTVLYLLFLALFVYCIYRLILLRKIIQEQTKTALELDKKLYTELRMLQYKALNITAQANKYTKRKNFFLGDVVVPMFLALLPFKRIKSLLYLHKLGRKIV